MAQYRNDNRYRGEGLAENEPLNRQEYYQSATQQTLHGPAQDPFGTRPRSRQEDHFEHLRAQRQNSRREDDAWRVDKQPPYAAQLGSHAGGNRDREREREREQERAWGHEGSHSAQLQPVLQSATTPGADNYSEAAAGGMAAIAYTVAERNARESGLEAMRRLDFPQQAHHQQSTPQGQQRQQGYSNDWVRERSPYLAGGGLYSDRAIATLSVTSARGTASPRNGPSSEAYGDDPYQQYSPFQNPHLGVVDPSEIDDDDDGDDGIDYGRRGPRSSILSLGSSPKGRGAAVAAGAVGAAAAAGGIVMGALLSRSDSTGGLAASTAYGGSGAAGGNAYDLARYGEKRSWRHGAARVRSKKWKLCVIFTMLALIIAAIACGILFGLDVGRGDGGGGGTTSVPSAADDTNRSGDLDMDSDEIKKLLNNDKLHKIFPGIDYTPLNSQYPDCMHSPPSQNNITRDMAVLSKLTSTIRLYGTDCNQTQMVMHAIRQLRMEKSIKIWMGVWQDGNATTNSRQLSQMWDILDELGAEPFSGLIVANEIIFRKQMSVAQLASLLSEVRTNLTARGMTLPVGTSDLGDNWTAELADQSDYIMSNIHPFFAGVNSEQAAMWTYSFWETHNKRFFKPDKAKNIIAETGWPSQAGTDCGTESQTDCPDAAVAGIEQMNRFMADWVCPALANGTQYFWFEAFDEPWKIRFNTEKENWEDHWGLLDVNRQLKPGVEIPDCGGKTAD